MREVLYYLRPLYVSNPIREYLQIPSSWGMTEQEICFKPYKGVSSND